MKKSDIESLKNHIDSIHKTVLLFCAEGENACYKEFFDSTFDLLKEDIDYRSQNPIKRFFVDLHRKYQKWKHRNDSVACVCTIKMSQIKELNKRNHWYNDSVKRGAEAIEKMEDEAITEEIMEKD